MNILILYTCIHNYIGQIVVKLCKLRKKLCKFYYR